jgi:hypothetical protein
LGLQVRVIDLLWKVKAQLQPRRLLHVEAMALLECVLAEECFLRFDLRGLLLHPWFYV